MDTTLIEAQLAKVSPIIKDVFFSVEIAEEIAKIGEDNGLLLDQINGLIEETGYMVIGLKKANDYVNIISKKLQITEVVAKKIASTINDTVLKDIREEIQKLNAREQEEIPKKVSSVVTQPPKTAVPNYSQTPTPRAEATSSPVTPLEQAGRFTIDKPPVGMNTSTQYKETNIDKEVILKKIEDPVIPVEKPMVDHLLTTPVNTPNTQVEIKKTPTKPYSSDPYREQI